MQDCNCENVGNTIIVESLFKETTRNGKHTLRLVLLGLTQNLLMIASSHSFAPTKCRNQENIIEIRSLHPLDTLKFTIFKKSKRHTLKICFYNKYPRYFELDKARDSEELWNNWCKNILHLKQYVKKKSLKKSLTKTTSYNEGICDINLQKYKWNDKYLYLGSKREKEDCSRPIPIQGLGPPEDIKLLHLKPKYFGSWGQTEHWVQCEENNKLVQ